MEENKKTNGLAVASLVLGILSIVGNCIPIVNYITWACAIVGIVLAAKSKKIAPSGMATAGLVCSIIALAVGVICIIAIIACGAAIGLASL